MSGKLRIVSLLGVGCSSLCFLALPLIAAWIPASSWVHNEVLTRSMLVMFLAMCGGGSAAAFRHHRKLGPLMLALAGAALLISAAWYAVPAAIGWAGLGALIGSAFWDNRLMRC